MKKGLMMAFLGFFLICGFAFSEWKIGGKPGTEPDGFRGIKWGTDISTLPDMKYFRTDPSFGGVKMYIRKGDKLQMGAAKLESIEYGFWQGKLCNVWIITKGYTNWCGLKEATFEKFGKGGQSNEYIEKYVWFGTKTEMLLEYNEISEEGTLCILSAEISEQQKKWEKQKAKEGAETGF
ncbi:MAG: hypothetical protein PHI44_02780 [Candidatus Ratteibacteria bacterium]|nr:hypothetical protein [Candidatus Ratteibacteria bacterium]